MDDLIFSLLLVLLGLNSGILGAWQDGLPINSHLSSEILKGRIRGRFENYEEDHLSLLAWDEKHLFIGARDALFNLTTNQLNINSVLNWAVSQDHREMCQVKGQKDSDCYNFIRLFHGPIFHTGQARSSDDNGTAITVPEWIICGTNAFKPKCRFYNPLLDSYREEISGVGYSPFDPTHMSTSLLHYGAIYAATVADFGGTDALIYKTPLRTEQNDFRHLSSPSFVSSMSHGELALFFFRELAAEHTNCGKVVYSRVGRICRHDTGSRKHKDRFTTFLKARLNCSVPGEFPFYFDHIQGTSTIFMDHGRSLEMLYAVFTTPDNSIGASAICAFSVNDILRAFDGPFKGQSTDDSNWLPVPNSDVPTPRPGACPSDNSPLPETASVTFHKEHPLMDETVQGLLTLVHTSNTDRFRVIEVDPMSELTSDPFHILYIGTETGKVLKVIVDTSQNVSRPRRHDDHDSVSPIPSDPSDPSDPLFSFSLNSSLISASWQVSDKPIKTLRLLNPTTLLVGTETSVVLLPTSHCDEYKSCRACIQLRDPHCFWSMDDESCISIPQGREVMTSQEFDLRQDVYSGDAAFCPLEVTLELEEKVQTPSTEPENVDSTPKPVECCSCAGYTSYSEDFGNNRIPELDGHFRYAGAGISESGNTEVTPEIQIGNPALFENFRKFPLPRREFESSSVKSGEGSMSRGSIAMATVGSAFVALLIGFSIGFVGSRWLANKKNLNKTAATNAQFAASLSEQSQRLTPAKPIDFVVNNVNNWSGAVAKNTPTPKNNLTTDTLEKTVKKIYI